MLRPLKLMFDRVEVAREDGDTTLFLHLLYAGEMVTKLVTAVFVAAVAEDRERHQYSLLHRLVRADGLGEWAQALDEALSGPASQHLLNNIGEERRQLTERSIAGSWQYECVSELHAALKLVLPDVDALPTRVHLRQWFAYFVQLRNKTRGHGATTPAACSLLAIHLERSIWILMDNLSTFSKIVGISPSKLIRKVSHRKFGRRRG